MSIRKSASCFPWVIITCLLLCSPAAIAATHYVAKSGSNTYPYTSWQTAAVLIEFAVGACVPGDTVQVEAGKYHVLSPIALNVPGIVLKGAGIDSTIVTGKLDLDCLLIPADDNIISGFTFIGDTLPDHGAEMFGPGVAIWIPYPYDRISFTVDHCKFTRFRWAAVENLDDLDNCWILNCQFYDMLNSSLYLQHLGNFYIEDCLFSIPSNKSGGGYIDFNFSFSKRVVRGNRFVGSLGFGSGVIACGLYTRGYLEATNNIFEQNDGYDPCISALVDQLIIRNNTVLLDDPDYFHAEYFSCSGYWSDSIIIENNALSGTMGGIDVHYGWPEKCRIANNVFYSRNNLTAEQLISVDIATPEAVIIENNRFLDPMFVAPTDGDFHLQLGSPCIDHGTPGILDRDSSAGDVGATGGPRGIVYAYQNLPPAKPKLFSGSRVGNEVSLRWLVNVESDIIEYQLYRDVTSSITTDGEHMVAVIPVTDGNCYDGTDGDSEFVAFIDSLESRWQSLYYAVRVLDVYGELSELSEPWELKLTAVTDETGPQPRSFSLEQNYPNPFNSSTIIRYYLDRSIHAQTEVEVVVYNNLGQHVKTLFRGLQGGGDHTLTWNADDATGQPVASGIYVCVLHRKGGQPSTISRKMILLK